MVRSNETEKIIFQSKELDIDPFIQRFPWIGGDLQTLRDSIRKDQLVIENSLEIKIPISKFPGSLDNSGYLLGFLNLPISGKEIKGLILMLHGLGGSTKRLGLRRMAIYLKEQGFAVLKLNLRGAGLGRNLAGGTYSAKCTQDLIATIKKAKEICKKIQTSNYFKGERIPLFGVGISLGGTILLNTCLDNLNKEETLFNGIVCTSSPLDLYESSNSIERLRNKIYQKWLLNRLIKQTLSDPFYKGSVELKEFEYLVKVGEIKSIKDFDQSITAPRWGYSDVYDYYENASPIKDLINKEIKTNISILHSLDDPWVPFKAAMRLKKLTEEKRYSNIKVFLTRNGGHNGFHGNKGCWGDYFVKEVLINMQKNC